MIHVPENLVEIMISNTVSKLSEEILEDLNDQTCYSSISTGGSDFEDEERLSYDSGVEDGIEKFQDDDETLEYPFNAEYEDIFFQNSCIEEFYPEDETNYFNDEEIDYGDYIFNRCLGGMKFKHLANMKKVKQKFKIKKINPKRRLHHRELKKQQEEELEKREQLSSKVYVPPTIRYESDYSSNNRRSYHHSNSDEEAQLQQAISQSLTDHHVNQVSRESGIDFNVLLSLTQRELTAEDYDLLLQLDNTVKKKTVSESILDSLPCCTLKSYGEVCHSDMPQVCEGDMCITCMCDFEEGDELRWIPNCSHIFHKDCIDNWLNNHSTCCPICRVEINDS